MIFSVGFCQIDQVCGELRDFIIFAQFFQGGEVGIQIYKSHQFIIGFSGKIPDIHHDEKDAADDKGYKTAFRKFFDIGYKKTQFNKPK